MFGQYEVTKWTTFKALLTTENVGDIANFISANPDFLNKVNQNNETVLHLAAQYSSITVFSFITKLYGDQLTVAAGKLTNDGYLPIQYAANNKTSDKDQIYRSLEKHHLAVPFKPLQAIIDFKKIVNANLDLIKKDISLLYRLHYAWIAATYARVFIDASLTHPSSNFVDEKVYKDIHRRTYKFENEIKIKLEELENKNYDSNDEELLDRLDEFVKIIKNAGVGSCTDYSTIVLKALQLMGLPSEAGIYTLKLINATDEYDDFSDHVFVVLFDKERIDDYNKWDNAVLIDAWSGEIYPAARIPEKLTDLRVIASSNQQRNYNITCPFDSKLQTIEPLDEFPFSREFWLKATKSDFSEFAGLESINENIKFIESLGKSLLEEQYKHFKCTK